MKADVPFTPPESLHAHTINKSQVSKKRRFHVQAFCDMFFRLLQGHDLAVHVAPWSQRVYFLRIFIPRPLITRARIRVLRHML